MRTIHAANELQTNGRKVCLAVGVFDGMHLGHQQVVRQMTADAREHGALAVVVTFDRHPSVVVAPQRVPPLIYALPRKLRAIAASEADATLLIHFDEPFSRQSGDDFIRGLARDFGRIESICVGDTFTFGHKRSGNLALLERLGKELHFRVRGLGAVSLGGEVVSSTRIREAIRTGELGLAGQLLGRRYSLAGPVVEGDRLGRQLGFPTANINTQGLVLPPGGVYAGVAGLAGLDGQTWPAALNIGSRPTVQSPAPQLRVEAHLLDFSGEIYGQELEVALVRKIRDERKFESLTALREQIDRDVAAIRAGSGSV